MNEKEAKNLAARATKDPPSLAAILILCAEPTDRALRGWGIHEGYLVMGLTHGARVIQ